MASNDIARLTLALFMYDERLPRKN